MRWRSGTRLEVETTEDGAVILRPGFDPGDIGALIARLSGCLGPFERDPIAGLEADHRAEIEADERAAAPC